MIGDPARAVLHANEAFYRALADVDYTAMDALWARDARVMCIHPGCGAIRTRELIVESWRRIFAGAGPGSLPVCRAPTVAVKGKLAYVTCYEQLPDVLLVATNIFRHEGEHWRMVNHQASAAPDGAATRPN